jgi:hypothetical protein
MDWQIPALGYFDGQPTRPTVPQAEFLRRSTDAMFGLFCGGIGSGKTHIVSRVAIIKALRNGAGTPGNPQMYIVGAPSNKIIRDATFKRYLGFLKDIERHNGKQLIRKYATSDQNRYILLHGDILFQFITLKDPKAYAGPDISGFHIDEAALLDQGMDAWHAMVDRLRDNRAAQLFGMLSTSPRGAVGVVQHFVDEVETGNEDYYTVTSSTYDNPFNPPGYIKRLMAGRSKRAVRQQIFATLETFEGAVYSQVYSHRHNVARNWQIDRELKHRVSIDWGPSYPHVVFWEYDEITDRDVAFDEFYPDDLHHGQLLKEVELRLRRNWNLRVSDLDCAYGDNQPLKAKDLAKAWFWARDTPYRSIPTKAHGKGGIIDGVDIVADRFCDAEGIRRIYLTEDMQQNRGRSLHRSLEKYRWPERSSQSETYLDDSRPVKGKWDHAPDSLRYYITQAHGSKRQMSAWDAGRSQAALAAVG